MKDNQNMKFFNFLKKHWGACLILSLIPILALSIFILLMINDICKISDFGSMLGGTLAYLGTTILGAVSVWQVECQRYENSEILKKQNFEINKGLISIYVEIICNEVIFIVKNVGKSALYNGSIIFDETWLNKFDEFDEVAIKFRNLLIKSLSKDLYLVPNQEIRFFMYPIGTNTNYYNFLSTEKCAVKITYDTLSASQNIEMDISFHSILTSYYGQNMTEIYFNKVLNTCTQITKELNTLNKTIINLQKNKPNKKDEA